MTFSKTQRWLLLSAAALSLPSVLASWWMLASRDPAPADLLADSSREDKVASTPSISSTGTTTRPDTQPHPEDADGTAEGKTEADHFQQYAAALRAQGHAETTVRELTASRITAAFHARRTAIREQARRGNGHAAEIQAQLEALGREQGALIAELVGAEEQPAADSTTKTTSADTQNEKQVLMPAAMAEAIPATVTTGEQAADWEKVRADFVNAVGGAGQNPASPQYRKRWVQAQSEADQQFRLYFGDNAFVQHQMQAQHESMLREQGATGK